MSLRNCWKFVLFRLHKHCYILSVPISLSVPILSDQGTEFKIVGVDPVTLPLIIIRKSEVFFISNVSDI